MATAGSAQGVIQPATVIDNPSLCRDHFRLTLRVYRLPAARPGQFVHLSPELSDALPYRVVAENGSRNHKRWLAQTTAPLIRRAFSIAGLRRSDEHIDVEVIYHVVGTATRWMQSLAGGDTVSMLGPLGNEFPISSRKQHAWLVAGGVGLPPMLWLAEALAGARRSVVAFCGVRTLDLLPLSLDADAPAAASGREAQNTAREFARHGVPVVISSDDGSIGFHGHVGAALSAFHGAHPIDPGDLIVYTCGPEQMMHFVADHCRSHGVACYCCMERSMACGTGTCQSCVLAVHDDSDPDGWSYKLCCTDGPVFPATRLVWDAHQVRKPPDVGAQ